MELVNTLQADDAILARGQAVYRSYCEVCHGSGGGGDGTVAGRAGYPAPPSFLPPEAKARAMPDGQIFHIITYGGVNMPSYAAEVEQEDRWKVILWMRELQNKVAEDSIFGPTADGSAAEVAEAPTTSPVAEQPAEPGEGVTP
jgi:mono/diheme cytochrome c family protein